MPRIKSRPIEEVAWDVDEILKIGPEILYRTTRTKTALAEEISRLVAGCFELLVAELFSHNLGLAEIFYEEIPSPPCLIWNGKLSNNLPYSAPSGAADIEAYLSPEEALVIDVTLSSEKKTQIFEARRLRDHNPKFFKPLKVKRVLVAPTIDIESNDIEGYQLNEAIKNIERRKPREVSYWELTRAKVQELISN